MDTYTYSPVSQSEIRLVTVKPGGADGQLEASIKNVELDPDNPPKYTALSYCWGNAVNLVKVPCDGKIFSITTALHGALVEIIKFSPHDALWIDQICINQEDMAEKSEQVSKMNQIYDKAETVLAWLGPAVKSTELGVEFVKKVGQVALPTATDMFLWDNYDEKHEETKLERVEELTDEQSSELGIPFTDEGCWRAFSEFFDRPWFQRMWTVQEIIQARKAVVVCGPYSLSWEHVSAAARWFCYKAQPIHNKYPRQVDGMCLVKDMVAIPWRFKMGSEYYPGLFNQKTHPTCKWGLRDLLENLRPRLATDPRDKVFALLGISDIDSKLLDDNGMAVDYSMSVTDVFTQATDEIIKVDTSDLNVIWSARQRNEETGWPSWVPDWRLATGTGCKWGIGAPLKSLGKPNGKHTYIPTTDPHSLAVRGKAIGRVTYTNEHRHFGDLFQYSCLRQVYDACMARLSTYPTGENVKTAFGLTLIGGLPFPTGLQKNETSLETYTDKYMEFYDNTQMPFGTPEENAVREAALKKTYAVGLDMSWLQEVLKTYCERRFVVTDSGYMGLAHHEVLEGDVIAVVVGLEWPCVLRPKSERHDDGYEFVGDAYCHGVMNGEAVQEILNESKEGQVFTLR
ncbi:heterokaryon incompatibility protein [Fusarium austroafricanum]|uniref:Heterokaryon incompatibility protein n=1 Tax=Fusarium austroafricanum TaxID=2364996 RepID=A0A8H4P3B2_9HYPO|nr:heterokaryon incompatibility protein [Fusarium austroafricanum]